MGAEILQLRLPNEIFFLQSKSMVILSGLATSFYDSSAINVRFSSDTLKHNGYNIVRLVDVFIIVCSAHKIVCLCYYMQCAQFDSDCRKAKEMGKMTIIALRKRN